MEIDHGARVCVCVFFFSFSGVDVWTRSNLVVCLTSETKEGRITLVVMTGAERGIGDRGSEAGLGRWCSFT